MNISTKQAVEILELLQYVGDEVWGKSRVELELRTSKIEQMIKEGLEDEK